jgi:hypothetical protein
MIKIVSASVGRIEYSKGFQLPGFTPIYKGWLFYLSNLGNVMPQVN